MRRRPNPALSVAGLILACFVAGVTFADEGRIPEGEVAASQVTEGYINAPLAEVWRVFTTAEGLRTAGIGQAEIDLRVGGSIRSHDDPRAASDDPETRIQEILAYDPQRMLASRVRQAPASFPYRRELAGTWTVMYFTASGADMTHVRIVALGYRADAPSQALRKAVAEADRRTLDTVAKRYWPKCKLCTTESASPAEK